MEVATSAAAAERERRAMTKKAEKRRGAGRSSDEMGAVNSTRDFDPRAADLRRSRARSRGLLGVVLIGVALWFGIIAAVWAVVRGIF